MQNKNNDTNNMMKELKDELLENISAGVSEIPEINTDNIGITVDNKSSQQGLTVHDDVLISKYSGTEVKKDND